MQAKSLTRAVDSHVNREFPMSDGDFDRLRSRAYSLTGINLTEAKKELVYSRIARRVRKLGMQSFSEYCSLLETEQSADEISEFVNSITTNLTSFFRESHHFEFLQKEGIANLLSCPSRKATLRVWSAGCSSGEEPYTIAITLSEHERCKSIDWRILATDLDTNMVNTGRLGNYRDDQLKPLSNGQLSRFFDADGDERYTAKPILKDKILFKPLNLLDPWPMHGPLDIIFCRNVVIYFDKDTQRKLFARYAELLRPGGYLFIGHSESLHQVSDKFESLGKTMYRRL